MTLRRDALIKLVLPSLHVRLKSPNALWRLYQFYQKAVLKERGLYPIISGQKSLYYSYTTKSEKVNSRYNRGSTL